MSMKNSSITAALFLALFPTLIPLRGAEDRELYRTHGTYTTSSGSYRSYQIVVRESDVDKAPQWRLEQMNPPLPPGKAVLIASEELQKLVPECKDPSLSEIQLMPVGQTNQWIYVVTFRLPSPASVGAPYPFSIPVLMNGRVADAKPAKFGEGDFLTFDFDGTSVFQVLQMYREMAGTPFAGADLKMREEVPLNAEIRIRSRSASKKEALRILEKALREQVGVIITRISTNQFSVTYDEAAKKEDKK